MDLTGFGWMIHFLRTRFSPPLGALPQPFLGDTPVIPDPRFICLAPLNKILSRYWSIVSS